MRRITFVLAGLFLAINMFAMEIEVIIEGKHFAADIEDNETGRAFCALLPMTLNMSDLNGNEKYHYLSEVFPTNSRYYAAVEPGDLMIYGNSCVVLFYDKAGGYSYTRLGRLTSIDGLADAVGSGNVSVTFSIKPTVINEIIGSGVVNDKIFDLNSCLLTKEPEKGVFIKNGKKIKR